MVVIHNFGQSIHEYYELGKTNLFPEICGCSHNRCRYAGRLRRHGFYERYALGITVSYRIVIARYLCPVYAMVLLLAQIHFAGHLNLHIHEALRQRIIVHYEFMGLSRSEVAEYVSTLLSSAGALSPIFTEDAMEAIALASGGLPRKINLLSEKALILGAASKMQAIGSDVIQKVQQELSPLEP